MDKFRIEICKNSTNEYLTTPESFITLFVYNYLNCPETIDLKYIQCDSTSQKNYIRLNNSHTNDIEICAKNFSSLSITNNDENSTNCNNFKFPMYEKENLFIFGVCAVCRALVLESGEHDELLGFKKSCLLAPSEKSIWTKLCEIDMMIAVQEILQYFQKIKNHGNDTNEIQLPDCFTLFENHMGQPTRAHNFYKILRLKLQNEQNMHNNIQKTVNTSSTTLEHNYAEGYFFSLIDIILYPCISLLFILIDNEITFKSLFPLTHKWLKRIESYDKNLEENFIKIFDVTHYGNVVRGCKLHFVIDKNEKIIKNSLYRNDIKNVQEKLYTNQLNIDECLRKISEMNLLNMKSVNTFPGDLKFNWENIPKYCQPEFGGLPKERLMRKKHQLRNLADTVIGLAQPNDVIVDFCSGTGHLGIILAICLPQCHIIFLENKSISILKAKERIEKLNLRNCSFYQSNIDYFDREFNIGVSLHACGTATDIVLMKCIEANAKFVCCPCCYGSISPMPHIRYPLSRCFQQKLNEDDYLYLAHAADQSHDISVKNFNLEKREQGEFCMDAIDSDRKCYAVENGYTVVLKKLYPEDCTPKNRLLVGFKEI